MPDTSELGHEGDGLPDSEDEVLYGTCFELKNFTGVVVVVDRGWLRHLQSIFSPQEPLLVFKKYEGEVERKG